MSEDVLQQCLALAKRVEALEKEHSRSEGALVQFFSTLREEFGISSLAEAEKLLKKLNKEAQRLEQQAQEELEKWQTEWKDKL